MNLTDEQIDIHLDAILRGAGSALRHYTMQKSRDDMRAALRSAITAAQPEGWQPIETAPRDGTSILILYNGCAIEACWECVEYGDWESWSESVYWWSSELNCLDDGDEPTHWMPLPAAPATPEQQS